MSAPRIALIHATPLAMEPINDAFGRLWPQARCMNILDDSLSSDLAAMGRINDGIVRRFHALADYAIQAGVKGILFTCSAFGPAIESVAAISRMPTLKPNEAIFEAALEHGRRIGMLTTFAPAIAPLEEEFWAMALERGVDVSLETCCVPEAFDAARMGDAALHDQLVAAAAARFKDHDAVLLVQFSTSTARALVEHAVQGRCPVFTSPDSAVLHLQRALLNPGRT